MLARHTNELYRRLERVDDLGTAEVRKDELLRWYGQERLTRNVWRDIDDKWAEICEPDYVPLLVGDSGDLFVFAYGQGLVASPDSWFRDVREWAGRAPAPAPAQA